MYIILCVNYDSIKTEEEKELCHILFYFQIPKKKATMLKVVIYLSRSSTGWKRTSRHKAE